MGQSGVVHDFRERLAWSESASDDPFWEAVYRKAFPNLVNHIACPGDVLSQRMGIDRVLVLTNGRTLYIDEKKRSRDYGDVLLEYVSVDTSNAPGWMAKDLAIDYLAYAIVPERKCYLFPWHLLRRVWLHFCRQWIALGEKEEQGFRIVKARNRNYNTLSVAVPTELLQRQLKRAAVIDVSAELVGWTKHV